MSLLQVQDLKMHYATAEGHVKAVDGISFKLEKGRALGIAGESGCGKSSLALTIVRLLPKNGKLLSGTIDFDGSNLLSLPEETVRDQIRWKKIAIIFQGAMNALTPVHKVGMQIVEAIRAHMEMSEGQAWERSRELLKLVGINPDRANNYPHEFSGGMRQRVMIAMALACDPELLIADEPTTALDVIVQAQIIRLLKELQQKMQLSLIVISHDISILSQLCNELAIMYAGKIAEHGTTEDVLTRPLHPYTQRLLAAVPSIHSDRKRMMGIPGSPPDLLKPPLGCRFHPRCPIAESICARDEPALREFARSHRSACHFSERFV